MRTQSMLSSLIPLAIMVGCSGQPGDEPGPTPSEPAVRPAAGPPEAHAHDSDDADNVQCIGIPARQRYSVWLEPNDLTTGLESRVDGLLRVHVSGDDLSQEDLDGVMRRLELVTWPSGSSVPTRATVASMPVRGSGDEAIVSVVPQAPLRAGWYALKYAGNASGREDKLASRFRVGSYPLVRTIAVQPGDEETGFSLDLSEPIADPRSAAELVSVKYDGRDVACRAGSGPGLAAEGGGLRLAVICSRAPDGAVVSLSIQPDVKGRAGRALLNPFGASSESVAFRPADSARPAVRDDVFNGG